MNDIKEKLRTDYYFDIESVLRYAFEIIKRDVLVISVYSTIYILSGLLLMRLGYYGIAIYAVLTGPLIAGFYHAFAEAERGERLRLDHFFVAFRNPLPYILVNIVTSLLAAIGIYLLVIPGIYLYVAYFFAIPFTVYHRLPLWEAMEASRIIITRKWFAFFLLILILMVLNFIGALLYGFGLIFTLPFTYAAVYVAFASIFGESHQEKDDDTDADKDNDNIVSKDMFR